MKKLFGFLLVLISCSANAGKGPFSLGAILGNPTGLSGKMDLDKNEALDGAFSWSLGSHAGTEVHVDYLRIRPQSIEAGDTWIDLYYGIGGRLISLSSDDNRGKLAIGPRAPIGLSHELADPRIQFFGEVALVLNLTPSTSADIDLGVGARYRF